MSDRFHAEATDTANFGDLRLATTIPPGMVDPAAIAKVQRMIKERREAARASMKRAWEAFGGPKSSVGLPLDPELSVRELTNAHGHLTGYDSQFRGGIITLNVDATSAVQQTNRVVSVDIVGIECQIRQEKTDEIYGVVSIVGPSNGYSNSVRIPGSGTLNMGPPGLRLIELSEPLLREQVVEDYKIVAALVEHDSGDVDVIAQKIAEKFANTARDAIGALTGAPAEAAVADSESFKENLATGLAWVFGDVLGMGDDAYNAEGLGIHWADLAGAAQIPLQPPAHHVTDPHVINSWTHRLTLSGTDDGGDTGQYAIYLRIWWDDITKTEPLGRPAGAESPA